MTVMTHSEAPDKIIAADRLFDGIDAASGPGFVAVKGDRIIEVGAGDGRSRRTASTEYHYFTNALLSPAFHDNHTFLTGTLTDEAGLDLSADTTAQDMVDHLRRSLATARHPGVIVGRGWRGAEKRPTTEIQRELERLGGATPVVILGPDNSSAWFNEAARVRYAVDDRFPSNEAKARFYGDLTQDACLVEDTYRRAAKELARKGVVSIKDIGFDDYLGILPTLDKLHHSGTFDLRIHFSFQPVVRAVDINAVRAVQAAYTSPQLRFHGMKLMTDGILPEGTAHLLGSSSPLIDYKQISDTAVAIDRAGIPVGLNADGDAAVRACLDIFERCRGENPGMLHRFSLSDASMISSQDLHRFAELDVSVEIYSQFILLFEAYADAFMDPILGRDRSATFNDFRGLLNAGALVTSGTDLPLFWPDIPDAIYSASHRRFADAQPREGWHLDRGMSPLEVMRTWTSAGARACALDSYTGTLTPGLRADIAVLSADVLSAPPEEVRETQVLMTLAGGRIVHHFAAQYH